MKSFHKNKIAPLILALIFFIIVAALGAMLKSPLFSYINAVRFAGTAGGGGFEKKTVTVTCTPPASYPAQPQYVNKSVQWHIEATSKSAAINSYWYRPVFDGVSGDLVKMESGSFNVPKTYSTIGKKKFKITVEKNGEQAGDCAETEAVVKVSPALLNR